MAIWNVTEDDLASIEIGAGILGTGGGGNPYLGRLFARELLRAGRTISVVQPADVPDDALVTSVGGMGAPVISIERPPQGDEFRNALHALEQHLGRRIDYVVPGEIGGSNSTRPLIVGAQTGIPVIDGDGMGRAYPELQMCTWMIAGLPATPAAIADLHGQRTIFTDIHDAKVLERYARAVTIQMGGAAGYAYPPMSGADLKRTIIPGTLTLARDIGDAVRRARITKSGAIDAVLDVMGGERLFTGKIVDVQRRLVGGFARGVVTIDGAEADHGRRLAIDFQNENLIARDETGTALAVTPDLICIVDEDTAAPITTEILRYGLRVTVIVAPSPIELKTDAALRVVGPRAFGYHDVVYRPVPGLYGNGRLPGQGALTA